MIQTDPKRPYAFGVMRALAAALREVSHQSGWNTTFRNVSISEATRPIGAERPQALLQLISHDYDVLNGDHVDDCRVTATIEVAVYAEVLDDKTEMESLVLHAFDVERKILSLTPWDPETEQMPVVTIMSTRYGALEEDGPLVAVVSVTYTYLVAWNSPHIARELSVSG